MEEKDATKLSWKNLTDWSNLSANALDAEGKLCICQADIDVFAENVYRSISKQLNIPYEYLKYEMIRKNEQFYRLKLELFKDDQIYTAEAPMIAMLKSNFMIPMIEK